MEELILRYLSKYYEINLYAYEQRLVQYKYSNELVTRTWLSLEINVLYGFDECEYVKIVDTWFESEIIRLEVDLVNTQDRIYCRTGIKLNLNDGLFGKTYSKLQSEVLSIKERDKIVG